MDKETNNSGSSRVSGNVVQAQRRNPDREAKHQWNGATRAPLDPGERFRWLEEIHGVLNHGSVVTMTAALKGQVEWPTRKQDLQEVVGTCDLCQRQAVKGGIPSQVAVVTARSNWMVNDEASADLITSLPRTSRGNTECLNYSESFCGFLSLRALRQGNGKDCAAAFLDIFLIMGFPRRVRCDRGEVLYPEVQALFSWCGIQVRASSSHRPQTNGQVERINQEVRNELARLGDDDDWDANLSAVAFYRNSRPSRRADVSAFQMLFGVEPRLPMVERLLPSIRVRIDDVEEAWTSALKRHAKERFEGLLKFKQKMREYEAGRKTWAIGDLALVRNFTRKKGEPRWKGPYAVTEVSARAVKMRTDAGHVLVVNQSDAKPYRQPPRAAGVENWTTVSADTVGGGAEPDETVGILSVDRSGVIVEDNSPDLRSNE